MLTAEVCRSHRSVVLAHPRSWLSVTGKMGKVFDDRIIKFSKFCEGLLLGGPLYTIVGP